MVTPKRAGSSAVPHQSEDPRTRKNFSELVRLHEEQATEVSTIGDTTTAITSYTTVTSSSGTLTLDFSTSTMNITTLGENITSVPFPTVTAGQSYVLVVVQDGTGSRTITGWNASFLWPGGTAPTLSTGANDIDVLSFLAIEVSGTTYLCGVGEFNFT